MPGQQAKPITPSPHHQKEATAESGSETGVSSLVATWRSLTSVLPVRRIFGSSQIRSRSTAATASATSSTRLLIAGDWRRFWRPKADVWPSRRPWSRPAPKAADWGRKVPVREKMAPLNQRLEIAVKSVPAAVIAGYFKFCDQLFDTFWAGCENRGIISAMPSVGSQEPRS